MKQLGIFAKFWEPGFVKTRLAASIGADQASCLHYLFVQTLLARFSPIAERRLLVFSPPDRRNQFQELAGVAWQLSPQSPGDLGQRMAAYFEEAFANGAQHVVLIGSDSPTLPTQFIQDAFSLLQSTPVVLGPAEDGGYYLIGLSQFVPEIFADMPWSTPQLFTATTQLLRNRSIHFATLPSFYDVDEVADLKRLFDELNHHTPVEPAYEVLQRKLSNMAIFAAR